MDLVRKQHELELLSVGIGVRNYHNQDTPWREGAGPRPQAETIPGLSLINQAYDPVLQRVTEWLADMESVSSGNAARAANWLRSSLDPVEIVYIAMRTLVDAASVNLTYTNACFRVGNGLVELVQYKAFEAGKVDSDDAEARKRAKGYAKVTLEHVKKQTVYHRRMQIIRRGMGKIGVPIEELSVAEKVEIGACLFSLIQEVTGLFTIQSEVKFGSVRTRDLLAFQEHVREWLDQQHDRVALLQPVYLPMVAPPSPWEGTVGGGYLSGALPGVQLVRASRMAEAARDALEAADLGQVCEAVNALQDTRFRVNQFILHQLTSILETGTEVGVVPSMHDLPLPAKPMEGASDAEWDKWKQAAKAINSHNATVKSRRVNTLKLQWVAQQFQEFDAIYFPHVMDFRGRAYNMSTTLNTQGTDIQKALVEFADGMALGDHGAFWLAVHVANCWGHKLDKRGYGERVHWVQDNCAWIVDCGTNPTTNTDWTKADDPWLFLAACREWAGYQAEGEGFISHLPISVDGSNNGLQHFAAALRDREGGVAVNLTNTPEPEDVYAQVARNLDNLLVGIAEQKLKKTNATDPKHPAVKHNNLVRIARAMRGQITRDLVKQPVMTLPYGVTPVGMQEQLCSKMDKLASKGEITLPEKYRTMVIAVALQPVLSEAIAQVVKAAPTAMQFVQECAKAVSKTGQAIQWTTPDGLPVYQGYYKTEEVRIRSGYGQYRRQLRVRTSSDRIDTRGQAMGITPNLVHSWDGSHLRMTVRAAKAQGISAFMMIHDSYATHAGRTQDLQRIIREQFVELHNRDLLREFRDELASRYPEAQLPELPEYGNLELEEVKESQYFFA